MLKVMCVTHDETRYFGAVYMWGLAHVWRRGPALGDPGSVVPPQTATTVRFPVRG
jgi:hypothetical protein